jgi:hypothetical protein
VQVEAYHPLPTRITRDALRARLAAPQGGSGIGLPSHRLGGVRVGRTPLGKHRTVVVRRAGEGGWRIIRLQTSRAQNHANKPDQHQNKGHTHQAKHRTLKHNGQRKKMNKSNAITMHGHKSLLKQNENTTFLLESPLIDKKSTLGGKKRGRDSRLRMFPAHHAKGSLRPICIFCD